MFDVWAVEEALPTTVGEAMEVSVVAPPQALAEVNTLRTLAITYKTELNTRADRPGNSLGFWAIALRSVTWLRRYCQPGSAVTGFCEELFTHLNDPEHIVALCNEFLEWGG